MQPELHRSGLAKSALQFVGAVAMAVLLLGFIVLTRFLDRPERPDQEIRPIEVLELAAPAPPPPSFEIPTETPPPPPPPVDLPRLEMDFDTSIPALTATTRPDLDLSMETSSFSAITTPVPLPVVSAPKPTPTQAPPTRSAPPSPKPTPARSTYSSGELDSKPSLVNRPSVSYPASMKRQGNPTGKVLLEVVISTSGRVTVKRVIGSNHDDFSAAAKSFATRARFSVPKKDGRPVTAIYKWPIILKP